MSKGNFGRGESLRLAASMLERASDICGAAGSSELETMAAIEQAFSEITVSRDELVRVWAVLQLCGFAARNVAPRKELIA